MAQKFLREPAPFFGARDSSLHQDFHQRILRNRTTNTFSMPDTCGDNTVVPHRLASVRKNGRSQDGVPWHACSVCSRNSDRGKR